MRGMPLQSLLDDHVISPLKYYLFRSNGGAVDTTIDQLLAMTADIETTQDTTKEHETPPPSYQNNLPSYNQAVK